MWSLPVDQEQENNLLTATNQQHQQTVAQLEDTVASLRGEAVDQQKLLSTIAQDKATVSRCGQSLLLVLFTILIFLELLLRIKN